MLSCAPGSLLALLASAVGALAGTAHDINVGATGLTYSPQTLTASAGDTLVFHFYSGDHNVVQGDFSSPCSPSNGGFYSGFINPPGSGEADQVFVVTLNDTNPIWIYCSQVGHCQAGMAMVVNPPASGNTLAEYLAAAKKTTESNTPANVGGGVISPASPQSASSSGAPASSSSLAAGSTGTSTTAGASSSTGTSSGTSASSSTGTGTGPSTSASASPKASTGHPIGTNLVLSIFAAVLAIVAFWIGLV